MKVADYVAPASVEEATALLAGGSARVLAGGNNLLVEPNRSRLSGTTLVDLRRVPGLTGVSSQSGGLSIGAMTTLSAIASDAGLRKQLPVLVEAARSVGDAQVRNRATIGGSLAEADPGSDIAAVLIALGTQVQVQGSKGKRSVAAEDLFASARTTSLGKDELIVSVTIPAAASRSGSAYEKFQHPATLYALCGVAVSLTLASDGTVSTGRVALAGAGEVVTRLRGVEAALSAKRADPATFASAAQQAAEGVTFRGDHFGSAEYRRHLATVLTERALSRAAAEATRGG